MKRRDTARVIKRAAKVAGSFNKIRTREVAIRGARQHIKNTAPSNMWHSVKVFFNDIIDAIKAFFRIGSRQPMSHAPVRRPKDWHGTTRNGRHRGAFGQPKWKRELKQSRKKNYTFVKNTLT
jgi:hypothetical protein